MSRMAGMFVTIADDSGRAARMPVTLSVEEGPHRGLPAREVSRRARVVFAALGLGQAELSLVLTTDARIQALNRDYRHKDRPTDVLAFAMREGELGDVESELLGDVIVSVETARRQATREGHDVLAEVTMLLVHGLLHLLGWDHETVSKDRRMRAETARLVAIASAPKPARRPTQATKAPAKKGSTVVGVVSKRVRVSR
jgi:probable rRNA maturation factor